MASVSNLIGKSSIQFGFNVFKNRQSSKKVKNVFFKGMRFVI